MDLLENDLQRPLRNLEKCDGRNKSLEFMVKHPTSAMIDYVQEIVEHNLYLNNFIVNLFITVFLE